MPLWSLFLFTMALSGSGPVLLLPAKTDTQAPSVTQSRGTLMLASAKPCVTLADTVAFTCTSTSVRSGVQLILELIMATCPTFQKACIHESEQAVYHQTSSICSEIQTPNCGKAFYYRLSAAISTLRQSWLSPKSWYSFQICWLGLNLRRHRGNHKNSSGKNFGIVLLLWKLYYMFSYCHIIIPLKAAVHYFIDFMNPFVPWADYVSVDM